MEGLARDERDILVVPQRILRCHPGWLGSWIRLSCDLLLLHNSG